ncbi:MAG: hypothetical protein F6K23_29295 [Okeania sp. SIO2C9]|uniref:hypothetical protein n=1 Tax=Okeania sp. SIO2C9 TaxID=2607791 RepID=UPI0013C2313F|nr:hypothetical protein [Okeania sp. SIO2C9]NEQ76759.1 hypothetical protein [Okeania sp. SIO2C9]
MVNNLNAPPIKSLKPDIIGKNGWLVKKLERKHTTYILRSRVSWKLSSTAREAEVRDSDIPIDCNVRLVWPK